MHNQNEKGRTTLLEIGTEEIPARFIPRAMSLLAETAKKTLEESRIACGEPVSYATPRRLAVVIDGVADRQEDIVREAFGPPTKAAFNPDGTLTKAAVGFAASVGVSPDKLTVKQKGKGEYVAAVVEEKGRQTADVLPEALKKIVLSLSFPKSMKWGEGSLRFVRPIHWILALYGENTVEFEIDGIKSGNTSRGHRFLAPGTLKVKEPEAYLRLLENNFVIADPKIREKLIIGQAENCAKSVGASLDPKVYDELLTTVIDLVEYPTAVLGDFSDKYLELPAELLRSVMFGHQKYFTVVDGQGKLKNNFVVMSNTKAENAPTVKAGAERVIRARLEDARFYFEKDKEKSLSDRLEDLKKVTYQEKLGSLHDKTMRVKAIALHLAEMLNPSIKENAGRAAELAKCDLVTGVVGEFPELQGIMGMHYAAGEISDVALALRDQYYPGDLNGNKDEQAVSAILALADRMDNIASFFSIGLKPSGSEDPFALRRQALAVIDILFKKRYPLTIKGLLAPTLSNLGHIPESKTAGPEILKFFEQRLEPLLESKGYEFDLIQSVSSFSVEMPLSEVIKRLDALREFKSHPEYNTFLTAIKRVKNIVPDKELPPVKKELLSMDEEKGLYEAATSARAAINGLIERSDYKEALGALGELTAPINLFFDKVLVMDKDETIRDNRLSLLKDIWSIASGIADFSRLKETV